MIPDFTTFPMSTTTSIAPIPTVIPGVPLVQELHDVGKRTLWYAEEFSTRSTSLTL